MAPPNTKKALLALLQIVDQKITSEVILVSFGGTALTLLGGKKYSLDIDFIVASAENKEEFYNAYFETVKELKLIQGEYPPFEKFDVGLLKIEDFLAKSQPFPELTLRHIMLYTMNLCDIVLSKNYRGLPKDKKDIVAILQMRGLSRQELHSRYIELLRQQDHDLREGFEQKYQEFLKDFGHLLKR